MPASVTIKIDGLKEMAAKMSHLSQVTKDHLGYRATYGAARNVVKSAQANIQSYELIDTGAMIGNVAAARVAPSGTTVSYDIGVRHGGKAQKKKDDDPWYWWLLEFGTVKRPGTPFLTLAFEQEKEKSLEIMRDVLAQAIPRELAKAGQ